MSESHQTATESRLLYVLGELERQPQVSAAYPANALPFNEQMKQVREFIDVAGEYEVAYESLVATIESYPFVLSGKAAICLLELGLLLGYKTERSADHAFDRRRV